MKKILILVFTLATAFYLFISFFSGKAQEKTRITHSLKLAIKTDPLTLDPRKSSDGTTAAFFTFLYQGLTRLDGDGKAEYALIDDCFVSDDGLRYIFHLKKVVWSDGSLLEAHQIKNSWLQVLDPAFGAYNADYLFVIKNAEEFYYKKVGIEKVGIHVLDSESIEVILEHPCPDFLELLANKMFFPVRNPQDLKKGVKGVFLGPFCLVDWKYQDKILLKKNPAYWDKEKVLIDLVELFIIEDEATQFSCFFKGELDWIGSPFSTFSYEHIHHLELLEQAHFFPTASLFSLIFNTNKPIFSNQKIRKALTYVINRDELIAHITQGNEQKALSIVPDAILQSPTQYFKDHDVESAKILFSQGLKELNITKKELEDHLFSYPAMNSIHILVQAIQQHWKKHLDFTIQLRPKEWRVYLSDLSHGNFDIGVIGKGTHMYDPLYFLSHFKSKERATNRTGWENEDFSACLDLAKIENNPEKRKDLIEKAQGILIDQMPIGPLFFHSGFYLKNSRLEKVMITPTGHVDFSRATLE